MKKVIISDNKNTICVEDVDMCESYIFGVNDSGEKFILTCDIGNSSYMWVNSHFVMDHDLPFPSLEEAVKYFNEYNDGDVYSIRGFHNFRKYMETFYS